MFFDSSTDSDSVCPRNISSRGETGLSRLGPGSRSCRRGSSAALFGRKRYNPIGSCASHPRVPGPPIVAVAGRVLRIEAFDHLFGVCKASPPIGEKPSANPAECKQIDALLDVQLADRIDKVPV